MKKEKEKMERGMYGANECGKLGTLSQGIPNHDKEPTDEPLTSLKNRFSAQHDVSMSEAMKLVGGKGTSAQEE